MKSACPQCGAPISFYKPEHPGIMKFKCHKCGHIFGVKINEVEIRLAMKTVAEEKKISAGGENKTIVGGETLKMKNPPKPQPYQEKKPVIKTDRINMQGATVQLASLRQKGRHFYNSDKIHTLKIGDNVIGRKDNIWMSDIMIDNDNVMSRRSVCLTVETNGNGYGYLLRVMKSTNPVLLNGETLVEKTQLYINVGDEFILGSTRFVLE